MFALASRSVRAIAPPTSSGTCEPPGASRKTKPPSRSDVSGTEPLRRPIGSLPWTEPTPASSSVVGTSAASARPPPSSRRANAGAGARAHGRGLGGEHHVVRHRRRVRRRPQRDLHRRVGPLPPPRRTADHDQDLQPDGRRRGSRAGAGPCAEADRRQPRPARRRTRRPLSRARLGRRHRGGRARRRLRGARSRREDRRLRPHTSTAPSCARRWRPAPSRPSRTRTRCSTARRRRRRRRSVRSTVSGSRCIR